ncbi:LIC_12097 family sensor histidine kinase [Leptospira mayottensis]|uniref:histidine kinase n=2 Tax=Leptospira mayottensis TaxID=1137606 RepID=A0AA87MQY7_9LEPT|nr:ATP-binding protein [Leptospira mayottensis]AXR61643.1 PAS domain-containing sensor histidine kinase [Leptospira mayottensis]AXR65085.1 PAS domain-containing sensor histidine kinase [Leptospira mayottensis]AXR69220.1 PAS domain-containing sensor histidine kinase [Leptospira mayottensis]AZQ01912.1 histidine kinase [Leptospira mayottensis 200901116]EKS00210.1 GHKL domain protein [Leptospira mayottensis 200901122]
MSSLQENLLERAGELQSILDGITEPLVLIDPGFRIRRVNRSTLEFSGQSSFSSIIGKKCYEVLYNRSDVCPYCPMKEMQPEEENFNQYFEYPKSDVNREIFHSVRGQKETLYLDFYPIEKDNIIGSVLEKVSNITRIREKEEENLRIRNLASLGIFISGVAHELNNPLTGMSLTLQSLLNNLTSIDPEFFRKRLDMMKEDLTRAAMIVTDIISFAKPDRLMTTTVDIYETIQKAKENVIWVYPVLSKNIAWEILCEPGTTFQFNPVKMERLFINLFKNSLQAFDYGEGKIRVEVRKTRNMVHIIVEDNAGGIPDNLIDKIFSPFFTKNKTGIGTGLGLSICHSIVREHSGELSVKSFEKKTRFRVSLPLTQNHGYSS